MIYLFFALMYGLLFLYFKHREKKDDYILIAFAVALLFLEGATIFNSDVYEKIGYSKIEVCNYTYDTNITSNLNSSICTTSYQINYNTTQGYFDVNNFFAFKAFDSNILNLSGIMLYFILIVGILYVAYKGLNLENLIR